MMMMRCYVGLDHDRLGIDLGAVIYQFLCGLSFRYIYEVYIA